MDQSKVNELITLIGRQLKWLDENVKSNDVVSVDRVLDKLAMLADSFGELVSDAYALANYLEDDYKHSVAEFKKSFKGGVAKGEIEAEVQYKQKKIDWTQAKNGYKKLSMKLDRIDKILESRRQTVSVIVKTQIKNI